MNPILLILILLLNLLIKEASAQKYDAEVVRYSTVCDVESNKLTRTDSISIQINDREGDNYTKISIPYSKNAKLSSLDAWIENAAGMKIRMLKKNEIEDRSAISEGSLYEDDFQKCFQLRHNVYPYRVIYTYRTTNNDYLSIVDWTPVPVIYHLIPTRSARLKVEIPKDIPFKLFTRKIQESKVDSSGSKKVLEWISSYIEPVRPEIFSRPYDEYPLVKISPVSFRYGIDGSLKDWESYGNWQFRLIQGLDVLPEKEKNTVSSLIKGVTDKKEIVKILYHYLQDNTRYIAVLIGIGGMRPYPASYVAENKYGDCKALTNYMKAMLKYACVESYYVNIEGAEQPHSIKTDFPGPQFNHAILAVPINKDTIWLDNTSKTLPFGYTGTFIQNRKALLISEHDSRLVSVPSMNKEDNLLSYKIEFELYVNGQAKVTLNNSFRGRDFEMFNHVHSDFNEDEKDRIIRDYMPFDNYEVVRWELRKLHRDTARIELNAVLNLYKYMKPLGSEYYFSLYPVQIPSFTPVTERKLAVVLPYPVSVSDTLIYNLPIGLELKAKSDPVEIKTIYGKYEMKLNSINGKIYAIKRFDLYPAEYTLVQYPEFYSFIKSVKEKDKVSLILKPIY